MSEADFIASCARAHVKRVTARGLLSTPKPKKKRNHKKRHGENRERAIAAKERAKRIRADHAKLMQERGLMRDRMRAYFAGEADDLGGSE